jgi:hypothetical protein
MAIPNMKVEVGFNLTTVANSPFFTLDDAIKGVLDNTEYLLGGTTLIDVTDRVKSIDIVRGRNDLFATYPAGEATIEFNNHDRAFDPLYPLSPFFGNIIPRREIVVSSNDIAIFRGWIEDWDFDYQPSGDSNAVAKAYDTFYILGNQVLDGFTPSQELAGDRINYVLDRPEINWPVALRDIESGVYDIAANPVEPETNVLLYLQNVAQSDPGNVFMTRDGKIAFRDARTAPTSETLVSFGPNDIPFTSVGVLYGSELLFNEVVLTREGGGTAIAIDVPSVAQYDRRTLQIDDMQLANDADMIDIAVEYAARYSTPQYRISRLDVAVHNKDSVTQDDIVGLDLGDICKVEFTPNNVGDPIVRYGEVIRVSHQVTVDTYNVELGFQEILYAPLVLDDVVFGRLDVGTLSV